VQKEDAFNYRTLWVVDTVIPGKPAENAGIVKKAID